MRFATNRREIRSKLWLRSGKMRKGKYHTVNHSKSFGVIRSRVWNYRFLLGHILGSLMDWFSGSRCRWRIRWGFGLHLFGLLLCHVLYELRNRKDSCEEIITNLGKFGRWYWRRRRRREWELVRIFWMKEWR